MPVDIAFSLNRTLQIPLLVVINSILKNTFKLQFDSPTHNLASAFEPLRINILVSPGDRAFFQEQIDAALSTRYSQIAIFRVRKFTSKYMQYARFLLKPLLPNVSRVIYLDSNMLVLGDIHEFFA